MPHDLRTASDTGVRVRGAATEGVWRTAASVGDHAIDDGAFGEGAFGDGA